MADQFPEGSLLEISFELRLPVAATKEQVNEWARYAILETGGCSRDNPLLNWGPEEWANSFSWEDTGLIGRREEFDNVQHPDGSRSYRVRYHREPRAA